jgi:DNA polymerase-3 subunit chi
LTEVAFHFGAPDKLAYAVRLLRKAVGSGARVLVLAPPALLQQLDAALWASAPTDFLPHCLIDAPEKLRSLSLVVLADEGSVVNAPDLPVLVNLGAQMPQSFEHHQRVIEVVSTDEEDRATARQRWKTYAAQGYAPDSKNLNLRS